jgi:hypothetical protein
MMEMSDKHASIVGTSVQSNNIGHTLDEFTARHSGFLTSNISLQYYFGTVSL